MDDYRRFKKEDLDSLLEQLLKVNSLFGRLIDIEDEYDCQRYKAYDLQGEAAEYFRVVRDTRDEVRELRKNFRKFMFNDGD